MKHMDLVMRTLLACLMTCNMSYAAQPEGKGQDKDKEPPGQERREEAQQQQEQRADQRAEQAEAKAEQAQAKAEARVEQAQARAEQRVETRTQAAESKAEQAAQRAERAERAAEIRQERQQDRRLEAESQRGGSERSLERRHEPGERKEHAKVQVASLVDSLNKLEHARWSYNPHDTRGQGNMGKVDMRDPFGFDKDSGREGAERGRPIREAESEEPTLNLAELVTLEVADPYLAMLQDAIAW
jgi:membrane protein involved in colicin uptake